MDLLWTEVADDASLIFVHQLIAAKLNVDAGWSSPDIQVVIDGADEWLVQNGDADGLLPFGVSPDTPAGQDAVLLASELDFFNNDGAACDEFTSTVEVSLRHDGDLVVTRPYGTLGCATVPTPGPWSALLVVPLIALRRR